MPRPPRPWFRFYSEAIDNRKLQNLAPDLFKLYVNLLCYANQAITRGQLGRPADVAFRLRTDLQPMMEQLAELRRLGFLDGGWRDYRIHDWSDWQPDSDANLTPGRKDRNAERTRKERATPAERTHRVEESREEEELEKEVEEEEEEKPLTRRAIFLLYDNYMGKPAVTQAISEQLKAAEEEYPSECVEHCFAEAAASSDGRRSWSYVHKILQRHAAEGCYAERPKATANGSRVASAGLTSAEAAALDRLGWNREREWVE